MLCRMIWFLSRSRIVLVLVSLSEQSKSEVKSDSKLITNHGRKKLAFTLRKEIIIEHKIMYKIDVIYAMRLYFYTRSQYSTPLE